MSKISNQSIINGVAEALQFISYYHPQDFIKAMHQAYLAETGIAAKNAIGQILTNSKMAAMGKRPLCQDTGLVVIFAKVGMLTEFDGDLTLQQMVNAGTKLAYTNADNPLRASMVSPPFGKRKNTGDNTPAVLHIEMVAGNSLEMFIAAKGGGSENKTKFAILNPADDIATWVTEQVDNLGAGWCPPGIIGLGIGGSPEKALLLAKESLLAPINIQDILTLAEPNPEQQLRIDLYQKLNNLGIGAQGLGGKTTVLDVKIKTYPTHAASLPIALIPNCSATRHIHINFDGSGISGLTTPNLANYPEITTLDNLPQKINLDDKSAITKLRSGEIVLLSGKILTARDAGHKRIQQILAKGEKLSDYGVNLNNRFIYYVGPVDPIDGEVVGPAGPTTSSRMDRYTEMMLVDCQIAGMIGKSERNQNTIDLIKQHKSIYFIAVGGAAFLITKAIKKSKIVAFADLGMEAMYEFTIEHMPVTVAVDSLGVAIHQTGRQQFQVRNT